MDLNPENLMSLKVTELRTELRKRGLPAAGLKQVLADRLKEALERERGEEEVSEEAEESEKEASPVQEDAPMEEKPQDASEEKPAGEDATTADVKPVEAPEKDAPTMEEPHTDDIAHGKEIESDVNPASKPATEEAEPAPEPEAMEASRDEPQVKEKFDEKAPEPIAKTTERLPSPPPPPEAPSPSREEVQDVAMEPAPEEKPEQTLEPVEASPARLCDDNQDVVMELVPLVQDAEGKEASPEPSKSTDSEPTAPIDAALTEPAASENVPAPPPADPIPGDVPPKTVIVQAMEIDPVDTLKRKRRSASPPPFLPSGEPIEEADTTPPSAKKPRAESPPRRGRDARFKGLFNDSAPPAEQEPEDEEDEAPVEPALHPVTRALYIRNLVRPLQEHNLRSHVLLLASRSDQELAESLIETFYLDSIKSHALIVFESPTVANRVRVGIHNKVFPPEKTRKPLWADFVPEENVAGWVEREKARGMGTRWEVVYDTVDGEVVADLIEANVGGKLVGRIGPIGGGATATSGMGASRLRENIDISNAPTGPRRGSEPGAYVPPPMHGPTKRRAGKVMDLDQLFLSTRTKPKLYYLPVAESVARERLWRHGRDSRGRH